jgi:hypothetical protein
MSAPLPGTFFDYTTENPGLQQMFDDFSYDFPAAEKITVFLLKSRRDYDNIVRTMRKVPPEG